MIESLRKVAAVSIKGQEDRTFRHKASHYLSKKFAGKYIQQNHSRGELITNLDRYDHNGYFEAIRKSLFSNDLRGIHAENLHQDFKQFCSFASTLEKKALISIIPTAVMAAGVNKDNAAAFIETIERSIRYDLEEAQKHFEREGTEAQLIAEYVKEQ